ncbi:MAG: glycosyltransferase family 2 protein [Candidatus Omnitrophota bacterium]
MSPKVVVVVLNWNMPADTIECIESCRQLHYDAYEIVLVDNHSEDDSVKQFRARFPDLTIIENPENLGYAGGNNVGLRYGLERGAEYVFLLNNDITLERECLSRLVAAAGKYPDAGILAPKVLYYDDRTTINSLGTSMDWLRLRPYLGECNTRDDGRFSSVLEKDILVGCALLLWRSMLEKVGLIDERFFIFHEEADWCLRSLKNGFRNLVVPEAVIYHKASKTMRKFSTVTNYYSIRNFLYFTRKNATPMNWIKTRIGLAYLVFKNLFLFVVGVAEQRRMQKAFFLGLWDYACGRMGKCRRTFA